MSLPSKFIVFLGRTFSGHNHDYSMLKQEFPPDGDWFSDIHVRVDLGYQGMQSDYNIRVVCALSRRFAASPERFAVWPQKAEKWHMARLLGVLHRPWRKVHTILYLHHR